MNNFLNAIEEITRNKWNYMLEGYEMTLPDGDKIMMHWAEVCVSDVDICGSTTPHFDPGDALMSAIEDLNNVRHHITPMEARAKQMIIVVED